MCDGLRWFAAEASALCWITSSSVSDVKLQLPTSQFASLIDTLRHYYSAARITAATLQPAASPCDDKREKYSAMRLQDSTE